MKPPAGPADSAPPDADARSAADVAAVHRQGERRLQPVLDEAHLEPMDVRTGPQHPVGEGDQGGEVTLDDQQQKVEAAADLEDQLHLLEVSQLALQGRDNL